MSLGLFEGFGVELEYMLVARDSLEVLPVADELIRSVAGGYEEEIERGALAWSNELVLHVIELKTNGPAPRLAGLAETFQAGVEEVNARLVPLGGRLLPTGMHPLMDPLTQTRLWPHEASPIYGQFDRIFGCRGHGWSNLQSTHLNLPFRGDDEFGRLHAAIRLVLPLLPALAASTPLMDGRRTGVLDNRLDVYRTNSARIPSVSGLIVPEPVFTRAEYEATILERIYADLAPHDPEGILRYEWANARGAIARFDRDTIEIRLVDVQECPLADLAIAALVIATLRGLAEERWSDGARQRALATEPLAELLSHTIAQADAAAVRDESYLEALGLPAAPTTAGEVWRRLFARASAEVEPWADSLGVMLERGPLARRILARLGGDESASSIRRVYAELAECLATGTMLVPAPTA